MKKYEKLTKFIPVLDAEGLGRWVLPEGAEETAAPEPEYQEVVFRLMDAVDAFSEKSPSGDADAARIVSELSAAFKQEEACPGVLIGYLENGTILGLLRELAALN